MDAQLAREIFGGGMLGGKKATKRKPRKVGAKPKKGAKKVGKKTAKPKKGRRALLGKTRQVKLAGKKLRALKLQSGMYVEHESAEGRRTLKLRKPYKTMDFKKYLLHGGAVMDEGGILGGSIVDEHGIQGGGWFDTFKDVARAVRPVVSVFHPKVGATMEAVGLGAGRLGGYSQVGGKVKKARKPSAWNRLVSKYLKQGYGMAEASKLAKKEYK